MKYQLKFDDVVTSVRAVAEVKLSILKNFDLTRFYDILNIYTEGHYVTSNLLIDQDGYYYAYIDEEEYIKFSTAEFFEEF